MRRLFALFTTAALVGALTAFVASPVAAQEQEQPIDWGLLCLTGTPDQDNEVFFFLYAFTDIWDLEATVTTPNLVEDLEFENEDGDIVTELDADEEAVAEFSDDAVEDGPSWTIDLSFTFYDEEAEEDVDWGTEVEILLDTCGFDVSIAGECSDDGLTVVVEVHLENGTAIDLDIDGGVLWLPNDEFVDLTFESDSIGDGDTAVSDPVELPGDLEGVIYSEIYLTGHDAVIVDGEPWEDVPFFANTTFDVSGCEIEVVPLEPTPPAPVAVEPAFTG